MLEGACCYVLADAAAQRCVLIDPLPEQLSRLAQVLRCQNYPIAAVLSSSGEAAHGEARALLAAELPDLLDAAAEIDALGWPLTQSELDLGARRLRRVLLDGGGQALLLSEGGPAQACCLAFVDPQQALALAEQIGPQALIAPPSDLAQLLASTVALERGEAVAAPLLQLSGEQLQRFVDAHPDALLIDVREPYEQFLSQTPELAGVALQAMPLSRFLNAIPGWLAEQQPLLFFCRSGNRSRQAAQALARLGHGQAWTLAGGLALLPDAPLVAPAADPALLV